MKLEEIGFYTLSDKRVENSSATSRLYRCELLITGRCNFRCPYCRNVGGIDITAEEAIRTLRFWGKDDLYAVRFSGGEPTIYPHLNELVVLAKAVGVEKIAISTNGSAPFEQYEKLFKEGVNDFSISLDACCASDFGTMSGGVQIAFDRVVDNIRRLSALTYVTVGVVLTDQNISRLADIILFAKDLGVADIRIIPAAQESDRLTQVQVDPAILDTYPILKYRVGNIQAGRLVRGLSKKDANRCGLVLDDMAVYGGNHYACIIHLREGGAPIGKVGLKMRQERLEWSLKHNTQIDPICSKNCLDVCVDFNNKFRERG